MTACGHTIAQMLHYVQLSFNHVGTSSATPLFSYYVVFYGNKPPGTNELTGNLSPSRAKTGYIIFLMKSG